VRDEILRGPVLLRPADADEEVLDHVHAALGVENLRVKLDAVEAALGVLDAGVRRVVRNGGGDEARRELGELVAVRIPDAELFRQAGEELAGFLDRQVAVAVFPRLAQRDRATEKVAHELDAVTDAKHGHAELEDGRIRMRCRLRVNALGSTGEDDAHDTIGAKLGRRRAEVVDFRVDLALADATCDDLRQLGTEIEDGDCLCHAEL
jgi:hypothetical protein